MRIPTMLEALSAPIIAAAQRDYAEARDRYRAALNFAATCRPIHRERAMAAVKHYAPIHSAAVLALDTLTGGPIDLSDPRD